MFGAVLAYLLYKKQFDTHDDPKNTGGLFYTSPSVPSTAWNLTTEAIATFVLVYWVLSSSPFVAGTGDSAPEFGNAALGYAGVAFVVIAIIGCPRYFWSTCGQDVGCSERGACRACV